MNKRLSAALTSLAVVSTVGLSAVGAAPAEAASKTSNWDRLAMCESGGNWRINTGNGYSGGLQFNLGTWRAYGGARYASAPYRASKSQQISVANRLHSSRGFSPWPACSRKLGLR